MEKKTAFLVTKTYIPKIKKFQDPFFYCSYYTSNRINLLEEPSLTVQLTKKPIYNKVGLLNFIF